MARLGGRHTRRARTASRSLQLIAAARTADLQRQAEHTEAIRARIASRGPDPEAERTRRGGLHADVRARQLADDRECRPKETWADRPVTEWPSWAGHRTPKPTLA